MAEPPLVIVAATTDAQDVSNLVESELHRVGLRPLRTRIPELGWDDETLVSARGVVVVVGEDLQPQADLERFIGWARDGARPVVVVSTPDADRAPSQYIDLGASFIIVRRPGDDPAERAAQVAEYMSDRLAGLRRPTIDLRLHPPVERPEPIDAAVIGSEIESLLTWAERFVADEANPDDLRDEVDARRRQLLDELQLVGQGRGSATVLTGLAAALLPLVRPERAADGLGAAADGVADATIALGEASTQDEIVEAGEDVVEALDHMNDEIGQAVAGWDEVKAAWFRGMAGFAEEDFWVHLNEFIRLSRERLLGGVGAGAAGGVVASWMGGPPWLVVTVVALGLLRARFPWIFRPPEDPPEE